jgi:hypothetical protein
MGERTKPRCRFDDGGTTCIGLHLGHDPKAPLATGDTSGAVRNLESDPRLIDGVRA